jgi:beta-glucuronidase
MRHIVFIAVLLFSLAAQAQDVVLNILGRNTISLNGKWNYIIDPYENGYYDYRYEPYDKAETPVGGYFLDKNGRINRNFWNMILINRLP